MPTIRSTWPAAKAAFAFRFSAAFMLPVSSPTRIPAGDSRADRERKCCSARISVGAIMALCQPLCQASQAQAAATAVLPEPTSP